MKLSSTQNESGTGTSNDGSPQNVDTLSSPSLVSTKAVSSSSTISFEPPNFGALARVYAVSYRRAERLNAASISEQEHDTLLEERQGLLDKELDGTITPKEANRLEYVRWSLDRIEDAKHGEALDVLDEYVSRYERFGQGLQSLSSQLASHTSKGRKLRRKRK